MKEKRLLRDSYSTVANSRLTVDEGQPPPGDTPDGCVSTIGTGDSKVRNHELSCLQFTSSPRGRHVRYRSSLVWICTVPQHPKALKDSHVQHARAPGSMARIRTAEERGLRASEACISKGSALSSYFFLSTIANGIRSILSNDIGNFPVLNG
jgi:hypothetical protein